MSTQVSEKQAREVAEAAREKDWKLPSFGKELFLGNFRLDLIHPQPRLDAGRPSRRASAFLADAARVPRRARRPARRSSATRRSPTPSSRASRSSARSA